MQGKMATSSFYVFPLLIVIKQQQELKMFPLLQGEQSSNFQGGIMKFQLIQNIILSFKSFKMKCLIHFIFHNSHKKP